MELLTGDIQRQVVGVDYTFDEVQIARHKILELLGDEHTAHVKLQGGALSVVVLEEIKGGSGGHVKDGLKVNLSFGSEVCVCKWLSWILRDCLVEVHILLLSDIILASGPDRFNVVDDLPIPNLLGDRLHFRLLLLLIRVLFAVISDLHVVIDFLHFDYILLNDLIAIIIVLGDLNGALLWSVNWHLHLLVTAQIESDGVVNEFGVLLDEVLDLLLLDEFDCIVLEVKSHAGSSAESITARVLCDKELSVSSGSPDVLLIIVSLRGHDDLVGNEEG